MALMRRTGFRVLALACAAALGLIPSVVSAAEQPTRIGVSSIETSTFPDMQATVTVLNNVGMPIQGLNGSNFELLEDGKSVPVTGVQQTATNTASTGITVVLGLDVSGSMEGKPLSDAVAAIGSFVDRLSARDEAAALSFGGVGGKCFFDPGNGVAADKAAVKAHLESAVAGGDTPLYDATLAAIQTAVNAPTGQRLVVIVTDGEDTCSKVSPDTVVAAAVRNGVPLYFIGLGPDLNADVLQSLASLTGGQYFPAEDSTKLDALYEGLTNRLRTQYIMRYRSAQISDRQEHVLSVRARTDSGQASTEVRFTPPVHEVRPALSLRAGQIVDAPVRIDATSPDPLIRLTRAEFFLDGEPLQTVTQAPLSYTFDPATLRPGNYTLSVRVTDVGGGVGEQSVQVEVPRAGFEVWAPWAAALAAVLLLPTLAIIGVFVWGGHRKLRCQRCHRRLEAGWSACPYCSRPEMAPVDTIPATQAAPVDTSPARDRTARPIGAMSGTGDTKISPSGDHGYESHGSNGSSAKATRLLNAASKPVGWFIIASGDHRGQRFRLGDEETTIGRDEANDVVLDDQGASREHAKVRRAGGEYYVTDLDTTNGTLVNGRRITRHKLQQGDQLTIGRTTLAFMPLADEAR